jgi:hypothetical protein
MEVATNMNKSKTGSFTKMPKFSKTSRWILSLGSFLIIFFLLFTLTNGEKTKSADLQKMLDATKAKAVAPVSQDIAVLQDTLEKERQLLENTKAQFPGPNSNVQLVDNFVKLAKSCGLEITSSTLTTGLADKVATGASYVSYNYELLLAGEAGRVPNFILGLSALPTLEIKSVNITPAADESSADSAKISVDCLIGDK